MPDTSRAAEDDLTAEIALKVGARRERLGLSQAWLAQQIGVAPQQISKYEKAANRISAPTLVLIARALRCEPADLLPGPAEDSFAALRAFPEGLELAELWSGLDDTRRASLLSVARALRMPSARQLADQLAVA